MIIEAWEEWREVESETGIEEDEGKENREIKQKFTPNPLHLCIGGWSSPSRRRFAGAVAGGSWSGGGAKGSEDLQK